MANDITLYDDRTIDVWIFQDEGILADGGRVATGIAKLLQRFLIELLTDIGSIPYLTHRGTSFVRELRAGLFHNAIDVSARFAAAAATAGKNLQSDDDEDTPDDERFARAELTSIQMFQDFAQLSIKLVSRAGNKRQVILPITTSL